ncbi:MAG: rhomboid family intramembrane serine protease [Bacteroidota bacterium]
MNLGIEQITLVLILANLIVTYKGETDRSFYNKYLFEVDPILVGKDYIRMISSGFLHVGWWHFIFNMYVLYAFGRSGFCALSESGLQCVGPIGYLFIYFASLLGGNFLALYVHRNHGNYRAAGASGAVSGVIFAAIAFNPFGTIRLFFFLPMPSWVFGLLYVAISIYGIKAQRDNIGHEAHLGGAILGMLLAILFAPQLLSSHPGIFLLILTPVAVFLYLIITRPEFLLIPGYFSKTFRKNRSSGAKSPRSRASGKQKTGDEGKVRPMFKSRKFDTVEDEINYYLDKGWENLSAKERKRFEEISRQSD